VYTFELEFEFVRDYCWRLFTGLRLYCRSGPGVHRVPWRYRDDADSAAVVGVVLHHAVHPRRRQSVRNARDRSHGAGRRVSIPAQRSTQSHRRRRSLRHSVPARSTSVLAGQSHTGRILKRDQNDPNDLTNCPFSRFMSFVYFLNFLFFVLEATRVVW